MITNREVLLIFLGMLVAMGNNWFYVIMNMLDDIWRDRREEKLER